MRGFVYVIHKYYTTLYGGLEYLWILVSEGVLEPSAMDTVG